MDFLNNVSLNTKVTLSVALVLGIALTTVALQWTPVATPAKVASTSPVAPAPSKSNVSKQVEERINHLKDVVAKHPSNATSAFELARTLQDGHDTSGALKYYAIGLQADPKNIAARVDYSLCLYQSGKEQEAFQQNVKVLQQDASNAHALYNVGAIYGNRGMSDSALYYWRKLISSHPHDELARKAGENLKLLTGKNPSL